VILFFLWRDKAYHFQQLASSIPQLRVSQLLSEFWAKYLANGLKGLDAKKNKGRDSYLTSSQKQQLSAYIEEQCSSESGGRLTGDAILKYVKYHFNVDYHPNAIYKLLEQLGFSWITSRSKHPKQSIEVQEAFKKVPTGNDP